jgi:hypothetical protein
MKRLLLTLALSALAVWAPNVMAGPAASFELQKAWKAVQAQQEAVAESLAKMDREAARHISGVTTPAGNETSLWRYPAGEGERK